MRNRMGPCFSDPLLDLPITPRQPPATSIYPPMLAPQIGSQWGFVLRPAMFSITGEDFRVTDQTNQHLANVSGTYFSIHDKQTIKNPTTGEHIIVMEKLILAVHKTYILKDVAGVVVATIMKKFTFFTQQFCLYRGEVCDDSTLLYTMMGDFFSFRYSIVDATGPIARAQANPFSQLFNFNDNESYFVEVAPGIDSVLVLAMCLVADEVHAEQEKEQQQNR